MFQHFATQAALRYRREAPVIPAEVLSAVSLAEWPGNVRELRNAAERLLLGLGTATTDIHRQDPSLAAQMDRVEKSLIAAALAAHEGNLKATYESLGLSRKTLYDKMQKHRLRREDFTQEDAGGCGQQIANTHEESSH